MNVNTNINAIHTSTNKLNDNALELSQASFENFNSPSKLPLDISRNLTDTISLHNGFDAQIRSINANNDILGTVLDIKS